MIFKKRSLRLYIYHNRYQELSSTEFKVPKTFFGWIFELCYYTGLVIIYLLISPYLILKYGGMGIVLSAKSTKTRIKIKSKNLVLFQKWKVSMAMFLLLVFLGTTALHSMVLASDAGRIKTKIVTDADSGVISLTEASKSLKEKNVSQAQIHFKEALQSFDQIQSDLDDTGLLLSGILKIIPQRKDADRLTQSAKLVAEVGQSFAMLQSQFGNIKLSAQGISGAGNNGENLEYAITELKRINSKIQSAVDLLEKVDPYILPESKRSLLVGVQSQLAYVKSNLNTTGEIIDLLSNLLLGQKEILIMFQNNNELRATGGFLGTFGSMKISNGIINKLHISSIYDLDGQLQEVINPPRPMYAVNDRWFLRDSNWFADFPTTAKKITQFYEKEGGSTPDMVVALTPTIVTDLLEITGPVTVPNYKITLTSKNFIELTQLETSVKYDKNLNKPKQFLADFFPLFLQKLSEMEGGKTMQVLQVFHKNLRNKEILLYSNNENLQEKFKEFQWAGEILPNDRDYLSIVSSNLGGTKTDIHLIHEVNLNSEILQTGEVVNTLTFTRKNPLPKKSGFENKSFIRFMVPEGSKLISAEGFSPSILPASIKSKGGPDHDVKNWENGLVQDIGTETLIGTEGGKTFFGNWLVTEGGEQKTITLKYKLPFLLNSIDKHSLLFQRQPGVPPYQITYQLKHADRRLYWNNKNLQSVNDSVVYKFDTEFDQFVGIILEQK